MALQTQSYVDIATQRSDRSLRVACGDCTHSEFIHSDRDVHRCLYSECECPGFRHPTGADHAERIVRIAEGRKRRGPTTRSSSAFVHP